MCGFGTANDWITPIASVSLDRLPVFATLKRTPFGSLLMPFLQTGILTAGMLFAVNTAYKIAGQHTPDPRRALRGMLPIAGFITSITFVFLWLYLG